MRPVFPIVRATAADLAYVVHLQKRHGDALGFIPRAALEEKIGRGQIWLATENDEPAGYLHHGSLAVPEVRIFQAAIQYDARRRHLGMALVRDFVGRATTAGAQGVSLRCLSFLDANAFWKELDFDLHATEPGARGTLNVWTKWLTGRPRGITDVAGNGLTFHTRLHRCRACGQLTTDTWTRSAVRHRLCRDCVATKKGDIPI
jgi:hypothetical protein